MAKRKSDLEKLFDDLYELTELFWPIGAIVSVLLTMAGFTSLNWVSEIKLDRSRFLIEALNDSWIGYLPYLLPIVIFLLAIIFALRSLNVFLRQNELI
ncbi:MAG: hypothetical protein COA63_006485 [Methylophaga sp.]|nr:hypothetical protein [Methylophaga sp.]